jgi:hypothetical protein
MQTIQEASSESQENELSPLENLLADLRLFRATMIPGDRHRPAGVLAGQVALLVSEYAGGRRPSRKRLKRFFGYIAGEAA